MKKVILIDNYDSFTFNLYHYLSSLKVHVDVIRNDQISSKEILKRKYNSLSGGEQRMVHFARTLLQSNGLKENLQKYIFFDEPTANLDIKRELNILNVIRKKAKEGYGIFIVLHDLNLAYNFSDRIVLIKDGKISKMGDPNDVFDDEILSEIYEVAKPL